MILIGDGKVSEMTMARDDGKSAACLGRIGALLAAAEASVI
jgi:hypothetical protein